MAHIIYHSYVPCLTSKCFLTLRKNYHSNFKCKMLIFHKEIEEGIIWISCVLLKVPVLMVDVSVWEPVLFVLFQQTNELFITLLRPSLAKWAISYQHVFLFRTVLYPFLVSSLRQTNKNQWFFLFEQNVWQNGKKWLNLFLI